MKCARHCMYKQYVKNVKKSYACSLIDKAMESLYFSADTRQNHFSVQRIELKRGMYSLVKDPGQKEARKNSKYSCDQ